MAFLFASLCAVSGLLLLLQAPKCSRLFYPPGTTEKLPLGGKNPLLRENSRGVRPIVYVVGVMLLGFATFALYLGFVASGEG